MCAKNLQEKKPWSFSLQAFKYISNSTTENMVSLLTEWLIYRNIIETSWYRSITAVWLFKDSTVTLRVRAFVWRDNPAWEYSLGPWAPEPDCLSAPLGRTAYWPSYAGRRLWASMRIATVRTRPHVEFMALPGNVRNAQYVVDTCSCCIKCDVRKSLRWLHWWRCRFTDCN